MNVADWAVQQVREAERLWRAGDLPAASTLCASVLRKQPRHAGALILAGALAAIGGDRSKALVLFDKAIAAEPDNASAHNNRALALQELGQPEAGLASVERALRLRPGNPDMLFNRANLYRDLGRLSEAVASYDRVIAASPAHAEAFCNRGVALKDLHRLDEALASFDRALALRPGYVMAHCNRAYTALLAGDLSRGLPAYEWRWALPQRVAGGDARRPAPPRWQGSESLQGRAILLYAEQGLGDTLQFCRYVPLVAALGARVVLQVQKPLVALLGSLPGLGAIITRDDEIPPVDYQCPLMSLPLAFGTTLETIPAPARYVSAPAERIAAWRQRLGTPERPRLGIAWSGSATNANDRARSIALEQLLSGLPPSWEVFGLQKDLRPADRRALKAAPWLRNLGPDLDFVDAAAVCDCMDLVLSVDTSIAHLGAATGRPTWILLPGNPDWRWLLTRRDSPWYPSVTLLRQERPGDWSGVLARVREQLASMR